MQDRSGKTLLDGKKLVDVIVSLSCSDALGFGDRQASTSLGAASTKVENELVQRRLFSNEFIIIQERKHEEEHEEWSI